MKPRIVVKLFFECARIKKLSGASPRPPIGRSLHLLESKLYNPPSRNPRSTPA